MRRQYAGAKKKVNGISGRLMREYVDFFPTSEIEQSPRPQKPKAVFRKLSSAFAFEHIVKPLSNSVQIEDVAGSVAQLIGCQCCATPVG